MFNRLFDIFFSLIGLIVLLPVFIIVSLFIVFDSTGGVFYRQVRVGKGGTHFEIFKFRSMVSNADKKGLLTVGGRDSRITRVGYVLRKYKLDELPQLFNVLAGDMSLVGPRPEVPKYVTFYSPEQRRVLEVRPGITDEASLQYFDENRLLAQSDNPEKTYIEEVMPEKIRLNMQFINDPSASRYFGIILRTLGRIVR